MGATHRSAPRGVELGNTGTPELERRYAFGRSPGFRIDLGSVLPGP